MEPCRQIRFASDTRPGRKSPRKAPATLSREHSDLKLLSCAEFLGVSFTLILQAPALLLFLDPAEFNPAVTFSSSIRNNLPEIRTLCP